MGSTFVARGEYFWIITERGDPLCPGAERARAAIGVASVVITIKRPMSRVPPTPSYLLTRVQSVYLSSRAPGQRRQQASPGTCAPLQLVHPFCTTTLSRLRLLRKKPTSIFDSV